MSPYLDRGPKVSPPAIPPRLVPRPRLTDALAAGARGPLTLVAAGPGSGKTVALTGWAASGGTPTAWLSLDPSDNEPRRLWPLVARALLAAGIIGEADSLAGLPYDGSDPDRFVAGLLDSLGGPADVALVLDDAHLLTHPLILRQLDALVCSSAPRLHLVLGARSDPMLPLHRYRLAGQLAELRAADLAMTRSEARAVLAGHGVALRGAELDLLTRRTEGWTAGLRLSAMRMAGSRHPGRFVTQLALDQGSVGEYLLEEVLARQPADVRRLLIQTSFLDEVCGPLATAVTEIEDGAALLAELARSNSFVAPVEREGGWYRCHQLLLEVLRYLLKREYPGKEQEFQHRAASWYEQRGDPASAIRCAVGSRDWQHAARIFARGGLGAAFVARDDLAELGLAGVLGSAQQLDVDALPVPELELTQAAVAASRGELDRADSHLRRARAVPLQPAETATAALVELMAAHQTGVVIAVDRAAESLLAVPQAHSIRGLSAAVLLARASARHWQDAPHAEVEALLLQAADEARASDLPAVELDCRGMLQLAYSAAGRAGHARRCAADSDALIRRHPHLQRTTAQHLAHALGAHQQLALGTAERALLRARQTMAVDADPPLRAAVVLTGAAVEISGGRVAEAHHVLHTAVELNRVLPGRLAHLRTLLLADIEIRLGRPQAALKLLGPDPARGPDPRHAVIGARAYVALNKPDQARRWLRPVLLAGEIRLPRPVLISALLVAAGAADLAGDAAEAVADVLRACALSAGRLVQPFADLRDLLAGLLARCPEAQAAWPLTAVPPDSEQTGLVGTDRPLPEPLTARELTILQRLATTMTTQEIAGELCVSVNTVKTHIAAIYRKLPAAGRRDAVTRARQLELL